MFLFDREIEKVDAFYTTKLGEIRNRIRTINRNIRKQDCLTPELEALGELLMCELNTSSPISDYSNHNEVAYSFYDEKDPLVLEQIEECRVWVLKLSQYASLNTEGFRKALKKFDKKHPKRGTSILESQYSLKVLSKGFAKYQSTLGHIEDFLLKSSSLVGHKLLSSQSPSDHSAQNEPIKEIRRVWEDIYKLQVRSVLESDDLAAFKSIIPSMQLKVSVSSLEAKADESKSCFDSIVIREHTLLIKYLLDSICAHQSVHCLSHVIESEGLPIEQIERLLNISLVDRVLTSLAPRDPVKEQKASQMIEMLLGSGSNLEWRDFRGRNLLHKAVLSSSPVCVTKILEKVGKDLLERPDYDGIFPLFLVIERNLSQICAMLLMALTDTGSRIQLLSMSNKVLHPIILASKLGYLDTLKVLLEYNAEIDAIDLDGETAVYHCSKRNAVECLELLLSKGANPNIAECYRLWTPIFAGAAAGFERCCSLLIKFGADLLHRDRDGWMAAEHSAFRGHMELLTMLRPHNGLEASGQSCFEPTAPTTPISEIETVKEYGHAFLEAGTQLRITFGHGYGDRAQFPAVELLTSPNIASNFLQLRVSVNNSSEMNDARIFDLPLRDYHESLSFNISNTEAIVLSPWVELRFDLLRHVGGELSGSVGRGSIMLQSLLDTSGQPKNKGSVQLTCAVLSRSTMEAVALVSFQALIATPFKHSNLKLSKIIPYHKSVGTKIIGHRGLGANSGLPHPQIGENTVLSFVMAASLGAEYVEFGMQRDRPFSHSVFRRAAHQGQSARLVSRFHRQGNIPRNARLCASPSEFSRFAQVPSEPDTALYHF